MLTAKVYNQEAKEIKTLELPEDIFAVEVKPTLLHEVVTAARANQRENLSHTKGRSDVRGGGKKPWRQKGTGRARHGSIRSPLWRGGGVTFGPTKERNFSERINDKVRKKALKMVLTNKLANNQIFIVDKLAIKDGKTKVLNEFFVKLIGKDKKATLVMARNNENVIKAAKNLPNVQTLPFNSLNVLDLLRHPSLVITEKAIMKAIKLYK
ncbi:MAG: 50S ribosomal protein L4 [Candidatus Komeilibacteria bacterium]